MIPFAFFGSSHFSIIVLDELEKAGFLPSLIVSTPDKPQGRKLVLTPNVVKTWAIENKIPVLTPVKLDAEFVAELKKNLSTFYVVASYGKIIPQVVLDIPERKTLNIHPSLLPIYRGASPLQSAILDDAKNTGVTIMRIDEQMDHGPLVAQEKVTVTEWPTYEEFEEQMARAGAKLLARIMPDWAAGKIEEKEQDHAAATYTKKFTKEDGLLDLTADPYFTFRKIQAFHEWPGGYFFIDKDSKKFRVKVTSAAYKNGTLAIEKVIPEGGKEMSYEDFRRGYLGTK